MLQWPELCRYREGQDPDPPGRVEVFVAGAGNYAHLHFDWDYRHTLLYQVFGRKRAILIRPEWSAMLAPIFNSTRLRLQGIDGAERERICAAFEAVDVDLFPGDTLYMPALMWHCVDYVDTAMSLGFRF